MRVLIGPAYNRRALYGRAATCTLAAWWAGWARDKQTEIPADVLMLLTRADDDEFEVPALGRELLFGEARE